MQKFERADFEVAEYVDSENYGKFVLSPLERGFGTTIGNALRRVLLSSLPGAAVFSIKVDGVYHEFTTISGVREDVSMIILNLKKLVMKIEDDEVYDLQISAKGPCTITAGDIICPAQVEILNKDLEIAHLEKDVSLEMELKAKNGRGYISALFQWPQPSHQSLCFCSSFLLPTGKPDLPVLVVHEIHRKDVIHIASKKDAVAI